jgi:hypothetical protein
MWWLAKILHVLVAFFITSEQSGSNKDAVTVGAIDSGREVRRSVGTWTGLHGCYVTLVSSGAVDSWASQRFGSGPDLTPAWAKPRGGNASDFHSGGTGFQSPMEHRLCRRAALYPRRLLAGVPPRRPIFRGTSGVLTTCGSSPVSPANSASTGCLTRVFLRCCNGGTSGRHAE